MVQILPYIEVQNINFSRPKHNYTNVEKLVANAIKLATLKDERKWFLSLNFSHLYFY